MKQPLPMIQSVSQPVSQSVSQEVCQVIQSVSNHFFLKTAGRIFMKLHMKLWYFKGKKVTEPDYEKISFWVKSLKKIFQSTDMCFSGFT